MWFTKEKMQQSNFSNFLVRSERMCESLDLRHHLQRFSNYFLNDSQRFSMFPAANVAINDTNEWIHGPEYTFHVNLSYLLSADVDEDVFYKANLTTAMKCRPASSDQLFCRFGSMFIGDSTDVLVREEVEIEDPFVIRFDERGIMNLLFPDIVHNEKLNTIRSIVKQLSVGANFLQDAHALPAYVAKENYVLGECATLFTVLEYEDEPGLARGRGEEPNYGLRVLSLPQQKVNSVVVIEKRTEYKRCSKLPSSPDTMPAGMDIGRVRRN